MMRAAFRNRLKYMQSGRVMSSIFLLLKGDHDGSYLFDALYFDISVYCVVDSMQTIHASHRFLFNLPLYLLHTFI